jgi:hypothetical protein
MELGDYPLIESYLAELRRQLRRRWVPERRILDKVAADLVDAADQARASGRSYDEAQLEALSRFGSANSVAEGVAKPRRWRSWLILAFAAACSVAIAYVDSRPTWDDTGVTAAAIVGVCGLLGFVAPRRAWIWALVVGGGIPMAAVLTGHGFASLVAVPIALAGTYAGAGTRLAIRVAAADGP